MWEGKEEEGRIESVNWRDMETELAERSDEVTVEEACSRVLFSVCHRCQKRLYIFNFPVLLFLQSCFNFKKYWKNKQRIL